MIIIVVFWKMSLVVINRFIRLKAGKKDIYNQDPNYKHTFQKHCILLNSNNASNRAKQYCRNTMASHGKQQCLILHNVEIQCGIIVMKICLVCVSYGI